MQRERHFPNQPGSAENRVTNSFPRKTLNMRSFLFISLLKKNTTLHGTALLSSTEKALRHKSGTLAACLLFHLSSELATASKSDTAVVEPKVIAAKEHQPSCAPRRVTVERKRRAYEALDIEQLLIERGVNYGDPQFEAKRW